MTTPRSRIPRQSAQGHCSRSRDADAITVDPSSNSTLIPLVRLTSIRAGVRLGWFMGRMSMAGQWVRHTGPRAPSSPDHRRYRTRRPVQRESAEGPTAASGAPCQATASLGKVTGHPRETADSPTIMTVHAHPDDEASKGAPTLARYAAQGCRTVLVCCTGGEEGDLQNPSLREPGQPFHGLDEGQERDLLASVRPRELAESAAVIGFGTIEMLGYRDSGMADSPANSHPDCFHMADLEEAVDRLVRLIRVHRPDVLITYSDEQSGYPHPDHLRVHEISVVAFDRAADPSHRQDLGAAHEISKLYYSVWSRDRMLAVHQALLDKHGRSPFEEHWFDRPGQDDRITTRVDVRDYMWARTGALRAHATQVNPEELFWFGLDEDELARTYPTEDWVLAASRVGDADPSSHETDLLERTTWAAIADVR